MTPLGRPRWLAVLLLLTVFGTGVLAGVMLDRTWLSGGDEVRATAGDGRGSEGADGPEGKKKGEDRRKGAVIERFADEIGLDEGQRARIDTILDGFRARMESLRREVRPRYDRLVDSARAEIEAVLEPGQVERYRELLRSRRDRDHDGDEEKKK